MNEFDKLLDGMKIEPHRESLTEDIILKASRLQQKATESFFAIFKNLALELLRPKVAFSLAALVIAVFLVGLNYSSTNATNEVAGSDLVIEEIYYAGL